jgi:hypothetical protein
MTSTEPLAGRRVRLTRIVHAKRLTKMLVFDYHGVGLEHVRTVYVLYFFHSYVLLLLLLRYGDAHAF